MQLDLRLLEVFCRVYEQGSFSKAGEALLLSQPTVSGHIKNLEEYLEVKLFDRLPRRIVPTPSAKLLYRHGKSILKQKQAAIQELKQFLNRAEGVLYLHGSTIPGEYLLPPCIAAFREEHPAVRVDVEISDSKHTAYQVLKGEADLGFVGAKLDMVGLAYHHFADDELALVVPNDDRWKDIASVSLEQLAELPFISRPSGSGTQLAVVRHLKRDLDQFNVVATLGSTTAVKQSIMAGLGFSILSLRAVRLELEEGILKTLPIEGFDRIRRSFLIAVHKNLTLSPLAQSFLEFIRRSPALIGTTLTDDPERLSEDSLSAE